VLEYGGVGLHLSLLPPFRLHELALLEHVGRACLATAKPQGGELQGLLVGRDLTVKEVELSVLLYELVPVRSHPGREGNRCSTQVLGACPRIEKRRVPRVANPSPQVYLVPRGESEAAVVQEGSRPWE
jgi:hypothetical protein